MSIISKIESIARRESFQPTLLGIFINPFYFVRRGLLKQIRRSANSLDGVMLDFGCGRKPYKNLFKVDKYIGLDIKESGHPHELSEVDVYYDGKSIPFTDEYFDSVFCSEVFEHVFEIDSTLLEINRVMRADGKILITVPFVMNDHEVPYDFGRYSTYGITHLLNKHGFEIIRISKSTNFIETIFQLWILYIHHSLRTKSKILSGLVNLIIISPFTLIGIISSRILPQRHDLYHNSIVLAKKISLSIYNLSPKN